MYCRSSYLDRGETLSFFLEVSLSALMLYILPRSLMNTHT